MPALLTFELLLCWKPRAVVSGTGGLSQHRFFHRVTFRLLQTRRSLWSPRTCLSFQHTEQATSLWYHMKTQWIKLFPEDELNAAKFNHCSIIMIFDCKVALTMSTVFLLCWYWWNYIYWLVKYSEQYLDICQRIKQLPYKVVTMLSPQNYYKI